jgi:hypothetical protein
VNLVVNVRNGAPCDVYVGRGSIWGNPFSHLDESKYDVIKVATRAEAIAKYEEYLLASSELMNHLSELRGKKLGCWCAPYPCHAEVLVRYANM